MHNFLEFHNLDIRQVYKKGSWKRLCADAKAIPDFSEPQEKELTACMQKKLNVEALFVTLKKTEKEYSPTTMYEDYAVNKTLFHWQSQNSISPQSPKGESYINHKDIGKKILLFVREQNVDEYGFTMSYTFLGETEFVKSKGARPMNVEWKLYEPMPSFILKESQKLAVG